MDRRNFLAAAASSAAAASGIRATAKAIEKTPETIVFLQPDRPVPESHVEHLRKQWDALRRDRPWMPSMVVLPAGWKMTVLTGEATPVESGLP